MNLNFGSLSYVSVVDIALKFTSTICNDLFCVRASLNNIVRFFALFKLAFLLFWEAKISATGNLCVFTRSFFALAFCYKSDNITWRQVWGDFLVRGWRQCHRPGVMELVMGVGRSCWRRSSCAPRVPPAPRQPQSRCDQPRRTEKIGGVNSQFAALIFNYMCHQV